MDNSNEHTTGMDSHKLITKQMVMVDEYGLREPNDCVYDVIIQIHVN